MLTVLIPVTHAETVEAFFDALAASDIPCDSMILILDAPGCEAAADRATRAGFKPEIHKTGNPTPPKGRVQKRARHLAMRRFSQGLVPDGPLLCLDDDTIVPEDVWARLSSLGPNATGVQRSRWSECVGISKNYRPMRICGEGVESVQACGLYCFLTTGEQFRKPFEIDKQFSGGCTDESQTAGMNVRVDWDCVCGHLTDKGVLWPVGHERKERMQRVAPQPGLIAACIPTRGIVFTEVVESVFANLAGKKSQLLTTVDEGLPDCMNNLVERALSLGAEHIWIVEEDTVPPPGILDKMLAADAEYIATDYPVGDGHTCFGFDDDGLLWTGFGCTLIKAEVFTKVKRPWFECNMNMVVVPRNGLDYFTADNRTVNRRGGHDLSFCSKLKNLGIQVHGLRDEQCRHLKMDKWNTAPMNKACHDIKTVPSIKNHWHEYLIESTVSIVIPCYNQGQFLAEAIESALAQSVPCEVIVVDDGSTDDATKVALAHPAVTLIRQKNKGLSAARNAGIRIANGTHILPLDADDKLESQCIEKMLAASTGGIVRASAQLFGEMNRQWMPGSDLSLKGFLKVNGAAACSMFPREAWEKVGGYDEAMTDGYEDWDFWVRLLHAGYSVSTVKDICWHRRMAEKSMTDHTHAHHDQILAYMREKWKRLGIAANPPTRPADKGSFTLGTSLTYEGREYARGVQITLEEAQGMKRAGLIRDAKNRIPIDSREASCRSNRS